MYSMLTFRRFRQFVAGLSLLAAVHNVGAVLLPLGFGLALVTGVSQTSLILPLIASTVLVGGALALLTLGAPPGAPASSAPITVQINPKVPLITPAGWTPPVAPSIQPTPPNSMSPTSSVVYQLAGVNYSTKMDWCNAYKAAHWQPTIIPWVRDLTNGSTVCDGSYTGVAPAIVTSTAFGPTTINSCPTGYTLSSGQCVLSNAALVQKPSNGTCTILRTGNVFSGDPYDPDCFLSPAGLSGLGTSTIFWSGGATGSDGGGSVTINNDNSVTINNTVNNSGGTRTVTTITGSAPASDGTVLVTGKNEGDYSGQGSAATSAPAPLTMPTDYNRESTQQEIKGVLDQLKTGQCGGPGQPACVMSEAGVSDAASSLTSSMSSSAGDRDSAFSAREALITGRSGGVGPGMTFPWQIETGAVCSPLVLDASKGLVFDLCAQIPRIHEILSYFFYLFTALGIFGIFFSKGEK